MDTAQGNSPWKGRKGDDKNIRRRTKKLNKSICSQMQFYFSDANMAKDRFVRKEVDKSKDGWVPLSVFSNFNRMRILSTDVAVIAQALANSTLLEVSEDKKSVRRKTAFVEKDQKEVDSRTIYVECLPQEANHDWVKQLFTPYGEVLYVSMPRFQSTGDFKGYAFVEFATKEAAKKAKKEMNNPPVGEQDKFAFFPRMGNNDVQRLKKTLQYYEGEIEKHKRKRNISDQSDDSDTDHTKTAKRSRTFSEGNENDAKDKVTEGDSSENKSETTKNYSKNESETLGNSQRENRKRKFDDSDEESAKESVNKQAKLTKEGEGEEEKEGKKNKVRNKKNKDQTEKEDKAVPELRVYSKKKWLALRGEYIQMQKDNMKKLKESLKKYREQEANGGDANQAETENPIEEKPEAKKPSHAVPQFIANVIIRVQSHVPMKRVELTEKVRKYGNIAYVDVREESMEGYIRCKDEETATKLADVHIANHAFSLVTGEDEKKYWEKLNSDREKKLNTKTKRKERGKAKLERKAETIVAQEIGKRGHVVFEED